MHSWYEKSFGEDYLRVYRHRNVDDAVCEVNQVANWLQLNKNDLILDLCCGAGRHTITLARQGFHVVGFDLSKTLLARAQEHAEELPIPFITGDMRELPFTNHCFDVVVNLFTSFGYFPSDEENQKVLYEMARVLKPGGRFVMDYMNPLWVTENLIPFSEREENGMNIREERRIEENTVCKTITIDDENGRRHYYERVKMYTRNEMSEMVKRAGFLLDRIVGNFQGGTFQDYSSKRMIFIGKVGKE